MDNHEFCSNCHESDFHRGQPCDPKKVAAVQAREKKLERWRKRCQKKTAALVKTLKKGGYPATLEDGHCIVRWTDIERFE